MQERINQIIDSFMSNMDRVSKEKDNFKGMFLLAESLNKLSTDIHLVYDKGKEDGKKEGVKEFLIKMN